MAPVTGPRTVRLVRPTYSNTTSLERRGCMRSPAVSTSGISATTALTLPQQLIVFLNSGRVCSKNGRLARQSIDSMFQQNGRRGQRRPQKNPFAPLAAEQQSKWKGDPETQAVEADQKAAPEAAARALADADHQVRWSALRGKQVSEPPDRQSAEQELPESHLCYGCSGASAKPTGGGLLSYCEMR